MVPTERIFFYLLNWLYTKNQDAVVDARPCADEIQRFTKFIFMRIYKSNMVQRTFLPSSTEVEMIRSMKSLIFQVYFFTGSYLLVPV